MRPAVDGVHLAGYAEYRQHGKISGDKWLLLQIRDPENLWGGTTFGDGASFPPGSAKSI